MENAFFNFIRPYLSYIDNGHFFRRPFGWLYTIFAALNLVLPLYVFYMAVDSNIFKMPAKFIIIFLLIWLLIAFAGWIGFQLWWDRKSKIDTSSLAGDEFIATPVFSHFIQTLGEWIGTYVGLVGFGFALLSTIILGNYDAWKLSNDLGLPFLATGWFSIIIMPIYGFLIVIVTRFLSEQIRALASIANNTKKNNN